MWIAAVVLIVIVFIWLDSRGNDKALTAEEIKHPLVATIISISEEIKKLPAFQTVAEFQTFAEGKMQESGTSIENNRNLPEWYSPLSTFSIVLPNVKDKENKILTVMTMIEIWRDTVCQKKINSPPGKKEKDTVNELLIAWLHSRLSMVIPSKGGSEELWRNILADKNMPAVTYFKLNDKVGRFLEFGVWGKKRPITSFQ